MPAWTGAGEVISGGAGTDEAARSLANAKSLEFLTGYLIEKALAVDNIFVFLMLFTYFAVPPEFQKRVLMIGIIGAIVLRTVMILLGSWLIAEFHWVLYLFGAFLVITGIKMWWFADEKPDLANNPVINWSYTDPRVRLKLPVRVSYQDDPEQAMAIMLRAARETPLRVARDDHGQPVARQRHAQEIADDVERGEAEADRDQRLPSGIDRQDDRGTRNCASLASPTN